jgi:hypothetical protein
MLVTGQAPAIAELDRRARRRGERRQRAGAPGAARADQEGHGAVPHGRIAAARVSGADQDRARADQRRGDPDRGQPVAQRSRQLKREDIALEAEQLDQRLHAAALEVRRRRGGEDHAGDPLEIVGQSECRGVRRQGDRILVGPCRRPTTTAGGGAVGGDGESRAEQRSLGPRLAVGLGISGLLLESWHGFRLSSFA